MILCVISSCSIFIRQDLQDLLDYVFLHHFPDESDENQSASRKILASYMFLCMVIQVGSLLDRIKKVFSMVLTSQLT